jgi:acyl-CoA thioester hydrolase
MDPSVHETRLRVRYGETDQMGVVHHANYALYVEESRTTLMRERGCSYAELERRGFGLPVRKMEMRFRAPARYEEELVVRTRIGRIGAASVTFESEIWSAGDGPKATQGGGVHVASITVELACVDLRSPDRKPVALPDDLRALLSP